MNVTNEVMMPHINKFIISHLEDKFYNISSFAKENDVPSVNILTGSLLNFLVNIKKYENVLELGCGIGLSTSYLLDSKIKYLDAVDLNKDRIAIAKNFIKDERVTFHNKTIKDFLKINNKKYDFVFIDTVKKDYLETWYLLKPFLNKDATIVFDDVFMYGLIANENAEIPEKYKNVVSELRAFIRVISEEKVINYTLLPVSDGILLINYNI